MVGEKTESPNQIGDLYRALRKKIGNLTKPCARDDLTNFGLLLQCHEITRSPTSFSRFWKASIDFSLWLLLLLFYTQNTRKTTKQPKIITNIDEVLLMLINTPLLEKIEISRRIVLGTIFRSLVVFFKTKILPVAPSLSSF